MLAGIAGTAGLHLSGLVVRAQNSREGYFLCRAGGCAFPLLLLKYLPAAFGWQGKLANALGIGYFTLQLISYLCDVRRGKLLPEERYARLLCYASFFFLSRRAPSTATMS